MLAITITLNVLAIFGIVFICFSLGFLIRGAQLNSLKRKIMELETEMLSNHADILDLQRDKAILEKKINESKIPVIPINSTKEEGESQAEGSMRKKILANQGGQKKS